MHTRNTLFLLLMVAAFSTLLLQACGPRVTRMNPNQDVSLSGRWNDDDYRRVAEEMISDALKRPWLAQFTEKNKRQPVVIIGTILNKSDEHINPELMAKEFRRSLINSGQVQFVAGRQERNEVRDERKDQHSGMADPSTIARMGAETGADFMLKGTVLNTRDELEEYQSVMWQTDFEMIDLSTNRIVWQGEKKIKKLLDRKSVRW